MSKCGGSLQLRTRVYGPSMWPFIWSGALVRIVPCEAEGLRPGDLVVLLGVTNPILHRVVEHDGRLCTQGDWNDAADRPIEATRLLGRVGGVVIGRREIATPLPVTRAVNRAMLATLPLVRKMRDPRAVAWLRRWRDRVVRTAMGRVATGGAPVAVRVVQAEDSQALRRAAWRRGQYSDTHHRELVCLAEGHAGYVVAAFHPTRGVIGQLLLREDRRCPTTIGAWDHYVDPWFRGRGLGSELVRCALVESTRRGFERMRVLVRSGTGRGHHWARLGFVADAVAGPGRATAATVEMSKSLIAAAQAPPLRSRPDA